MCSDISLILSGFPGYPKSKMEEDGWYMFEIQTCMLGVKSGLETILQNLVPDCFTSSNVAITWASEIFMNLKLSGGGLGTMFPSTCRHSANLRGTNSAAIVASARKLARSPQSPVGLTGASEIRDPQIYGESLMILS